MTDGSTLNCYPVMFFDVKFHKDTDKMFKSLRSRISTLVYLVVVAYIVFFWLMTRTENKDIDHSETQVLAGSHVEGYQDEKVFENHPSNISSFSSVFQPNNGDILVFFHIQKTGGSTFNSHLVQIITDPPCYCTEPVQEGACRCRNAEGYTWLFSRFTMSSSCGVHPPLPDLRHCAPAFLSAAEGYEDKDKKRFLYLTMLRDPVKRYISEWRHVQSVGAWPSQCDRGNTVDNCLKEAKQRPLSIQEFMDCSGNPANNRQVRMLATDGSRQCDDDEEDTLLDEAKATLESLSFFGLTEKQTESQTLFEATFGTTFQKPFTQEDNTIADEAFLGNVNPTILKDIRALNSLDVELYSHARLVFSRRLHSLLRNK